MDGLNLGPGVTRNPDGSFNYNGSQIPTGSLPPDKKPGMTYTPVNTKVPTVSLPFGTPGGPGAQTPSLTSPTSSSANFDALSKIKGLGSDVLNFIKQHPEMIPVVLGIINSARNSGKANDLQNEGLDLAREQYADRAPYREALNPMLLAPVKAAPDFSAQFANSSNPYSKVKAPAATAPATSGAASPSVTKVRIQNGWTNKVGG